MAKQQQLLLAFVFCLVGFGVQLVSGTQAWLSAKTAVAQNELVAGKVTHEIEEEFDGKLKKDVTIQNTGNVAAFIRVTLVPRWLDEASGNSVALATTGTYHVELNRTDWFEQQGIWYYKASVPSGGRTTPLIYEATRNEELPEEYQGKVFDLQVITQSVQAVPITAVEELWQLNPTDY